MDPEQTTHFMQGTAHQEIWDNDTHEVMHMMADYWNLTDKCKN
jgi:hypothetical protein